MRVAVLRFPGSNCDFDTLHVLKNVAKIEAEFVWHKETSLRGFDAVIVPGGFSYGDYLRCGAIARFSPIMKSLIKFANSGKPVLGICNGFQILIEAGLLPGALLRNKNLKFLCQQVHLSVEMVDTPFTNMFSKGEVITLPIAHGEGNYFIDKASLKEIEDYCQIVFRYVSSDGKRDDLSNPNGSLAAIAGLSNKAGNVVGLMPHPERGAESLLGLTDGKRFFESLNSYLSNVKVKPRRDEVFAHA